MRIAGIIAEYNPFHKGHAHLIEAVRASGADHIAVVMSGPFVQRGEIAVCSKFARAEMAIRGGADLVLELPAEYAVSPANRFARGGVALLAALGMDVLAFGSESGDPALLSRAVDQLDAIEASEEMHDLLGAGLSYPRARAEAAEALADPALRALITEPNNLLAIEYLRALRTISPQAEAFTIPRIGARHDGEVHDGIASASTLREFLRAGDLSAAAPYLPEPSLEILRREFAAGRAPGDMRQLERIFLSRLRQMRASDFAALPDVCEGLEHRLAEAAAQASSLEDFYARCKTKRYTHARIRRITCAALLDITPAMQEQPPRMLRVLAMNARGREILSHAKAHTNLPMGMQFADLYRENPAALAPSLRAEELFAFGLPALFPAGEDFTRRATVMD